MISKTIGYNGVHYFQTHPYTSGKKNIDPENSQFLMETSLPTPMTARVYVNLPEGRSLFEILGENLKTPVVIETTVGLISIIIRY